MPTLYTVTLGCPKNRVDTEVMLGGLVTRGFTPVPDPAAAEVILVNTCAFIGPAKEESIDTILELARHKETGACRTLVVAGCLPQRYGERLAAELPEVDHFAGTGAVEELAPLLAGRRLPRTHLPDPDGAFGGPRVASLPVQSAYLKIAEGCDNDCAFCIIPELRGPQKSLPIAAVVAEARRLVARGAVELNLVAQDLTAYGHDLPGRPRLHELLDALGELPARWIRLLYAYPRDFPDALVEAIARTPNVVKYLDLPLQHCSDRLLRRMRRGRDGRFLRGLLARLRAGIPGLVLRTSLIAGLPGETEEDFQELCAFVREQRFERLGVFEYSDEEGTAAFAMDGKLPRATIRQRRRALMAIQRPISREKNRALVGRRIELLVEGLGEGAPLVGRHAGQAPEIDGQVYATGQAEPGAIVTVEIDKAGDYDLWGTVEGSRRLRVVP